jgi:cell division protein ZapD
MTADVLYEQALNETVRACMRLEHLFSVMRQQRSAHEHGAILHTILHIIGIIDRPDLKNKLASLLTSQKQKLTSLQDHPDIDGHTLTETLRDAAHLIADLHAQRHLANDLIQHPFFKTLRQQIELPGGLQACNAPTYHLWMQMPLLAQNNQLAEWHADLKNLDQAVSFILHLIRASGPWRSKHTESGFYQEKLDPSREIQMIRIKVPAHILPEISAGAHLLALHFIMPQFSKGDLQASAATHIPFSLACCSEIF